MTKRFIILAKFLFILLAFYLVFRKIDTHVLIDSLKQVSIPLLLVCFVFQNISLIFSALRSRHYFNYYGLNFRKRFAVAYYYVGTFFNVILPGGIGGDGYKVYLLWKLEKFPRLLGLRIMLYERVSGFYILAFMGLVIFIPSSFIAVIPYGFKLSIIGIVMITPCYLWGVKYVLKDNTQVAVRAAGYSFIVQFFQVVSAVVLVKALLPEANIVQYTDLVFLFIVSSIAAIIPISIGGAGLRELTFFYGLELIPVTSVEIGVAFALLTFLLYLLTAIVGLPLFYNITKIPRIKPHGCNTNSNM